MFGNKDFVEEDCEHLPAPRGAVYGLLMELARKNLAEHRLGTVRDCLAKAIATDPARPEAFNLLGVLSELQGDRLAADTHYRTALSLDATYPPAQKNLARLTSRPHTTMGIVWQE